MLQCFLSRVRLHFHQALTVLEKIRKVATGVTGKELRKNRAEQGFFRSASPHLALPAPSLAFPDLENSVIREIKKVTSKFTRVLRL